MGERAEFFRNPLNVDFAPAGDLLEGRNTRLLQPPFEARSDPGDPLEIVATGQPSPDYVLPEPGDLVLVLLGEMPPVVEQRPEPEVPILELGPEAFDLGPGLPGLSQGIRRGGLQPRHLSLQISPQRDRRPLLSNRAPGGLVALSGE